MTAYKQPDGRIIIESDFKFPPVMDKWHCGEKLTPEEDKEINKIMTDHFEYLLKDYRESIKMLKNK